jgi:hypothetical protein
MSPPRLELPPSLWAAVQQAGLEMGMPAAQLVNQAVFAWASMHGYLQPSAVETPPPSDADVARLASAALSARPPRPDPALPASEAPPLPVPEPETLRVPVVADPEEEPEWVVSSPANVAPYEPTDPDGQRLREVVLHVQGTEVPVDAERFVIGRDVSCHLTIESPRLSRQHAAVVREGYDVVLEDLGSSNGTWFKDQRLTRKVLADGDVVQLGDVVVRVELR